jgi:endonuclease/exonuclease/phosphatase (EEP) superfamily protein YafD
MDIFPPEILALAWRLVAAVVVVATLFSIVPGTAWWLRVCDFPRAQLLVAGWACLVLAPFAVGSRWSLLTALDLPLTLALCGTVAWQSTLTASFTPAVDVEVAGAPETPSPTCRRVRVVVANLDYERCRPEEDIVRLLEADPDLLAVVENDESWSPIFASLRREYPHQLIEPRARGRGVAVLSRISFFNAEIREVLTPHRPSAWLTLGTAEAPIARVAVVHPAPPGLPLRNGDRMPSGPRDRELLRVAQAIQRDRTLPWIVTGDFNDVGWSATTRRFKRVSGLGDPRVGRGMFSTFPARLPLLRYPIDHVMVSPSIALVRLDRLAATRSDHIPLLATLDLPEGGAAMNARRPPAEP